MRPSIYILLVSLSLNGLFGYLSYKFSNEKGVAQAALFSCQETNRSLGKTLEKQEKELILQDSIASEYKQKQEEIQRQQCEIVEAITRLPSKQRQETPDEEIDIDSKLPPDLVGLLKQASGSLQTQSSGNATKLAD